MWIYLQNTGELYHDGKLIATGYSGHGDGKNNPQKQGEHNVGPIPCGEWEICGPPVNTPGHGPFVLRLTPRPETKTFGRDGFLIHGDSIADPGTASQGCVILSRIVRDRIWQSGDRCLYVLPAKPATGENFTLEGKDNG
jgi:Tlde1 domain